MADEASQELGDKLDISLVKSSYQTWEMQRGKAKHAGCVQDDTSQAPQLRNNMGIMLAVEGVVKCFHDCQLDP